jgi:hypothetical protein
LTLLHNRLHQRLTFISSGSRRLFGIIAGPSVCLVCDCKTTDQHVLHQYQKALETLLKEQISKLKRFNLIWLVMDRTRNARNCFIDHDNECLIVVVLNRVSDENHKFQEQPINVTLSSIDQAVRVSTVIYSYFH